MRRGCCELTLVPSLGAFPTILNVSARLVSLVDFGAVVVGG